MEILTIVVLAIIVLGIVALIPLLRAQRKMPNEKTVSKAKKRHSSKKHAASAKNKYRSVSIRCNKNACSAVKAIKGKRFLVEEHATPQLPLSDCDAAQCTCRYVHLEDRRDPQTDRRALGGVLQTQLYSNSDNEERREKRGRRASDFE